MKNLWRTRGGTFLSILGIVVLILLIGGFAFSRGYLTRYVVNGEDISLAEYRQLVETVSREHTMLGCVPDGALGFIYIYEVQCFDTEQAVLAYIDQKHGVP